jgi:hypothetical protein
MKDKEADLDNVEMHINECLKPKNFDDYEFYSSLEKVKDQLNRDPKSDLIIVFEDSFGPFILCGKAKCLRYGESYGKVISNLEKDKNTLLTLKDHNICSHLAYIILDDHYFIHKKEIAREIEEKLDEYNRNYGIIQLYHTSKAKIPLS